MGLLKKAAQVGFLAVATATIGTGAYAVTESMTDSFHKAVQGDAYSKELFQANMGLGAFAITTLVIMATLSLDRKPGELNPAIFTPAYALVIGLPILGAVDYGSGKFIDHKIAQYSHQEQNVQALKGPLVIKL